MTTQTSPNPSNYSVLADSASIAKPLLDDRSYRFLKLNSNDLHVLVINDPSTDRAAASLDVNVGAFADKKYGVSGLAHFCEHLLFMGTEKYPEENDYASYLAQHSGYSNAYTAAEHTNYYFQVAADHLEGALDRFAQFFIGPLFSQSCKDREIEAVNSENKKNLQNDQWRLMQLYKSTSNPDHPYNGFSTGNFQTLNDEPISRGLNVRDVLLDFYKNQYSANLMGLVVLGSESLDQLTEWAIDKFSAVPNSSLPRPFYDNLPIYNDEHKGKLLRVRPVMDSTKIEITFPIPDDMDKQWKTRPSRYFTHLLGHESKGSILYYLQKKNWLNGLASGGARICQGSSMFMVEAELTPEGLKHWEEVVFHVFQYIKMLHATEPQEWLWQEISDMSKIDFRFRQKQDAARTVSRMSSSLCKHAEDSFIPPQNLLDSTIYREFDSDGIKTYCSYLSPFNMRICLISQSFEDLPLREQWYGTEHSYEDISPELMQRLQNAPLNDELHLPAPNKLIPENFDIVGEMADKRLIHPYLIHNSAKFETWFKRDDTFNVPKGDISLTVHLPTMTESAHKWVLGYLLSELFDDYLNDLKFFASMVGMDCHISAFRDGFTIKTDGYSDKLPRFLDNVVREFTAFDPTPDRFESIKYKVVQELRNSAFEQPYAQIGLTFAHLLHEKSNPDKEKLAAAELVTFEDLKHFANHELWQKGVFVQTLVHGNFEYSTAEDIQALCEEAFAQKQPISQDKKVVDEHVRMQSHQLEEGERARFEVVLEDPSNVNSCLQYYIQVGRLCADTERLHVLTDLFGIIVQEPCFNQLRTKEQLGYIVFSGGQSTRSNFGVRFLVQSEQPCDYLEYRVEQFLRQIQAKIEAMGDDEFDTFKQALVDRKKLKLKNLKEESMRFWNAINTGYYDFSRRERDVEILADVTKEEFKKYVNDYIGLETATKSARLSVCLKSQVAPESDKTKAFVTAVTNFAFEYNLELKAEKIEEASKSQDVEALSAEIGEELRAKFVAEIQERAAKPVPEGYPKGQLYGTESEFKQKHSTGGMPVPMSPLSDFLYPKEEAHL